MPDRPMSPDEAARFLAERDARDEQRAAGRIYTPAEADRLRERTGGTASSPDGKPKARLTAREKLIIDGMSKVMKKALDGLAKSAKAEFDTLKSRTAELERQVIGMRNVGESMVKHKDGSVEYFKDGRLIRRRDRLDNITYEAVP